MRSRLLACLISLGVWGAATAQEQPADRAMALQKLNGTILATDNDKTAELRQLLGRDIRTQLDAANLRESEAWAQVRTRDDWEKFRAVRLEALRQSLGSAFVSTDKPTLHVTKTIVGEGYRIENLVYESRPGWWVTGNLYLPATAPKSLPGIILCHSHHNPKGERELREMGTLWAQLGCAVLVIDQVGHGERRQHPFRDEKSYPKPYSSGRQDYYFRYNLAVQLALIDESLIGTMVHDMRRGVDVLLAHAKVDPDKLVLMGAVAGGGDPAAVTAAVEPRIKAVVPFNFGGPQPETRYPLPDDAARTFNYVGGGGWESTRNLRLSARDGFQPWLIVGSLAPRGLIYSHEFAWDRAHDPVWARLEKIYGFYDAKDKLAYAHGKGSLKGRPPESTHCNNIGREHRKLIYPALEKWFQIPVPTKESDPVQTAAELVCWTPELQKKLEPRSVSALSAARADEQLAAREKALDQLEKPARRGSVQNDWSRVLGLPKDDAKYQIQTYDSKEVDGLTVQQFVIKGEVPVPVLVLLPSGRKERVPVVVAIAQEGKQRFLKDRSAEIAALLARGIAVCLPDLHGTGETAPGDGRGRTSTATSLSSSEQMLGRSLLGFRLRDLERVVAILAARPEIQAKRIAIWGESFAPVNAADAPPGVPLELTQPPHAEPLGTMLALLASLRNSPAQVILGRGGLVSYRSVLDSPFVHVPHDVLLPGAIPAGDVRTLLAHGSYKAVRLEGLVDGLNRRVGVEAATRVLAPANQVEIRAAYSDAVTLANWFSEQLK